MIGATFSNDAEMSPTLRLNIGIIIPSLEKYGGAERYLIECVKYWQQRHEITIYAETFNRDQLHEIGIEDSVNLVELAPSFEGEHAFLLNAVLLPKLWRQRIGRHDVYHAHLWPTHTVDLHPMVWFPHEPLRLLHDLKFEQPQSDSAEEGTHHLHVYPKYSYDHVSYDLYDGYRATIDEIDRAAKPEQVVANSRYMAVYLSRIYRREVPDVVYPGADTDDPIELKVDRKLFVTISQLWAHKRINLLIEAIALTDETQLIVIGSGPELDRLQSLCVKLGVEDRIFFLSGLNNREVRLVLARACGLLFCPIREPFGIVVLEAMAAGKPIIGANEGGYVEVCHPDFAILVPPSPLVIARKIEFLRDNPDQARAMGKAAQKAARQYSWRRTAGELEKLLIKASVDAKSKKRGVSWAEGRSRPLVGIQYYLWYGDGFGAEHWNDNVQFGHVGDHPFLGYYASDKGETIEYHLGQFEGMDLDFVILNLHIDADGPNKLELRSIRNLFEIAASRDTRLRFAVQISLFDADPGRIATVVSEIEELYADRTEYLHLDGKPVLFWFWSSAQDGDRALIESMREVAAEFRNLAFSLRLPKGVDESRYSFGFFEGFSLYSPLEVSSEENWDRVWQSAYHSSHLAGMHYRMVSVSPGYDDHSLSDPRRSGNPYRSVPRRGGETYARSLAFAESLADPPDFLVICTYNEYHENTHIESSSRNGDSYVEMTREAVRRLHAMVLNRGAGGE